MIGTELADPISGAVPHRRYPCEIEKIAVPMPDETTEDAAAFALLGAPAFAAATGRAGQGGRRGPVGAT